jgi:hypothetical protein
MADAAEIRTRLWEWQSVQGLLLVLCLCIGLPALLVLTWVHLTLPGLAVEFLVATLAPLAGGLAWGLVQIPKSISSTSGTVSLTFHAWLGKPRKLELRPEDLGHLKILSFGWFGSGLAYHARQESVHSWGIFLTKRQAQLFEGRVRRVSWLRG